MKKNLNKVPLFVFLIFAPAFFDTVAADATVTSTDTPAVTVAGKIAYERTLAEVHDLLIKGDVTSALARLEVAKGESTLDPLRAALDLESEFAHFIDDLNKAAVVGAAALVDKRAFILIKADGKEIAVGQGAKNMVTGVTDRVVLIDQDLGGAKAIVKLKFSDLSVRTRNELAALSLPKNGESALKMAFAGVTSFGTANAIPVKQIKTLLETARKEKIAPEKIAHIQDRIDAYEREPLAKAAIQKIDAACKAKKWKEASALIDAAKIDFAGTKTYEKARADVDQWFAELDAKFNPLLIPNAPADDEWCAAVHKLPVADQVKTVINKLKELNPKFDGVMVEDVRRNAIVGINFKGAHDVLFSIAPVKAFSDLTWFSANNQPLKDITPLRDMHLTSIWVRNCCVTDLSPLKGMKLKKIDFTGPATDLTPLEGMPLENVTGSITIEGAKILKRIASVKIINDKPAEETWKQYGGLADVKTDERPKVTAKTDELVKRWPFAELPDVLWYEDFESGSSTFVGGGGAAGNSRVINSPPCLPGTHALKLADWDKNKAKGERWSIAAGNVSDAKAKFPNGIDPAQIILQFMLWTDQEGEITLNLKHRDGDYSETQHVGLSKTWVPIDFKMSELKSKALRPEAKHICTAFEIKFHAKSHTEYANIYIDDVLVTNSTPPMTALQRIKALEMKKP